MTPRKSVHRNTTMEFRLTRVEKAEIRKMAMDANMSMSDLIRQKIGMPRERSGAQR